MVTSGSPAKMKYSMYVPKSSCIDEIFYVGPRECICIWRKTVHNRAKTSNEMISSYSLYHWNYKRSISALQPMVAHDSMVADDTSYSAHREAITTSLAFVNLRTSTGITRKGRLNTAMRFQANLHQQYLHFPRCQHFKRCSFVYLSGLVLVFKSQRKHQLASLIQRNQVNICWVETRGR
jgi:hypothetical protein